MAAFLSQYGKTIFFIFVDHCISRLALPYDKHPGIVID